jgi:hypothetical protein
MALVELLQKSGDGDFLRAVAEAVLQILMERAGRCHRQLVGRVGIEPTSFPVNSRARSP